MKKAMLVTGGALVALTILWFFVISFQFLRLDSTYEYVGYNEGMTQITFRDGTTEESPEYISREDTVIDVENGVLIVSDVFEGTSGEGEVLFEGSALYGVDAVTRKNRSVDGAMDREGYFTFPPFVKKRSYLFHSPEVLEAQEYMTYEREELLGDLNTYVFSYELSDLDKTQFFSTAVIDDYSVIGIHEGTVWVEPVSGRIVDFEHSGVNILVDDRGNLVRTFQEWGNAFTEDIHMEQIEIARDLKSRYLLIRFGGAGLLLLGGLFALGLGVSLKKK